jgi:hypothetical protein
MKGQIAIAIAVAFTGILTFGMIHAATNAASYEVVSPSTYGLQGISHHGETAVIGYDGVFVRIMVATWNSWGRVHGFAPLTHIDAFGDFYVRLIWLACPALGLIIFCFASLTRNPTQLWRSVAILVFFALPPVAVVLTRSFLLFGIAGAEAARCTLVLVLMIWSAQVQQRHKATIPSQAAA